MPQPRVLNAEQAQKSLKQGIDLMADLVSVTLGPRGGLVAHTQFGRSEPELLTDGATIARRIIQIPDRSKDVGAMLLRHMVWHMRQEMGDGSVITAVLTQAILREAHRCITAGANAMIVRRGLERALRAAVQALRDMAIPIAGEEQIAALATAVTGDPAMGRMLGEIFDILGPEGALVVEEYASTYLEREYVEGARWKGNYDSPYFINDPARRRCVLENPRILITDARISELSDIQPIMEQMIRAKAGPLAIIAWGVSGVALGTLVTNSQRNVLKAVSVKFGLLGEHRLRALEDMAIMTGARFITEQAGMRVADATLDDLGRARRIEVGEKEFTIIGAQGDPAAIRRRLSLIKTELQQTSNLEERDKLRERINWLSGGIGILKIGASSARERVIKKERAQEAAKLIAAAMEEGVVPGGGVAYLNLIPAVRAVEAEGDEAFGVEILARALQAPAERLLRNAGLYPPVIIHELQRRGPNYGYNVLTGEVVDMMKAGIMDAAKVLRVALETAVSGATMAFTAGALILRRKPPESFEP
ncbi:MAG: chaperonin GroEL [Anaerolineae bacterium]|nr:chaperonin GroEL [Anaerolineae bacterium]MDW8098188.1 chaperonin GroEL [Anaerolineae bacterium]